MRTITVLTTAVISLAGCISLDFEQVARDEAPAVEMVNELSVIGVSVPQPRERGLVDVAFRTEGERYWTEREEPGVGRFGIIEYSIFGDLSIAGRQIRQYGRFVRDSFVEHLEGRRVYERDYGSLRGGVGTITNVSVAGTPMSVPQELVTIDAEIPLGTGSRVSADRARALESFRGDGVLAGTFLYSLGVVEILFSENPGRYRQGGFYLRSDSEAQWEIIDPATSEVFVDFMDGDIEYPSLEGSSTYIELPVRSGDQDGLDRFLRSPEFDEFVHQALDAAVARDLYRIAPYSRRSLQ